MDLFSANQSLSTVMKKESYIGKENNESLDFNESRLKLHFRWRPNIERLIILKKAKLIFLARFSSKESERPSGLAARQKSFPGFYSDFD